MPRPVDPRRRNRPSGGPSLAPPHAAHPASGRAGRWPALTPWATRLTAVYLVLAAGCASPPPEPEAPTVASLLGRELPLPAVPANPPVQEQQAMAAYEATLASQPDPQHRSAALRRLGDLAMNLSDRQAAATDGAVPDYRPAIERYHRYLADSPRASGNDAVLYQLARAHEQAGDLETTLATLDQLVQQHPRSRYAEEAHFRRGELLFTLRRYAAAEQAYGQALRLADAAPTSSPSPSPFRERALFMQGWSFFKLGQLDAALQAFFRVLDGQLAGQSDALPLDELPTLSRANRELVEDSLRVVALSLASLDGAASLPRLLDDDPATAATRRSYALRPYQQLAALYLKQERPQDAADTLAAWVQREPLHPQAPTVLAQVVEIEQHAGFASLARARQLDFVQHFALGSPYQSAQPEAWQAARPRLRQYLAELTLYHHAQAQVTAPAQPSAAALAPALALYERWFTEFPDDPQTPEQRFLRAELLAQHQRWPEAIAAYEQVAYDPAEPTAAAPRRAEAAYAALLARTELLRAAPPSQHLDLQRQLSGHEERFAHSFAHDARASAVLTHAADQRFALGDGAEADRLAAVLLATQPPATPPSAAQRRVAWVIRAHHAIDQQRHADAEAACLQVLALTPAAPPSATSVTATAKPAVAAAPTPPRGRRAARPAPAPAPAAAAPVAPSEQQVWQERLAVAIYRQGEQARDAGDHASAAAHFERLVAQLPQASARPNAQFDAAVARLALRQWAAAVATLEDLRQRFPQHPLAAQTTPRLALAYTELGQWAAAAQAYQRLAETSPDPALALAADWQAAELQARAGPPAQAQAGWERYLRRHPAPLQAAVQARHELLLLARAAGNTTQELAWQQAIWQADQTGGDARTPLTRQWGAEAALALAAPLHASYQAVALKEPLAKALQLKKTRLQAALAAYDQAATYGVPQVLHAATFHTASLYQDFAKALLGSERPKKLSTLEREQYDVMLEEQAYPFEEKAIALHELNTRRTLSAPYDEWLQRSFDALRSLRPVRYVKNEQSEAQILALQGRDLRPEAAAAANAVAAPAPDSAEQQAHQQAHQQAEQQAHQNTHEQALAALRAGQTAQAQALWQRLAQQAPQWGGPLANLGLLHRQAGRLPEALAAFQQASAAQPGEALYLRQQGHTLRLMGRFTEAQAAYLQAQALEPSDPLTALNLGILLDLYLHQGPAAQAQYQRYQSLEPSTPLPVTKWLAELKARKPTPAEGPSSPPAAPATPPAATAAPAAAPTSANKEPA